MATEPTKAQAEGITGIVINGGFKHNGVHYPEVDPVTGRRTKLILPRADAERLIHLGRFMPPDEALAEQPAVEPESGGGKP